MTTTTSFSNNRFMGMFKTSILRIRSLTVFYAVLVFVFFPLQYIMTIMSGNAMNSYNDFQGMSQLYTTITSVFFTPIMLFMPLILGAQLFGDMHNKKSVDLYHSLPVKRSTTLLAKIAAGMASIATVLGINYIIALIVQRVHFSNIQKMITISPDVTKDIYIIEKINAVTTSSTLAYALGDVLCWLAILFTMIVIMAFVCVQVGTIFDTVVLTIGLYGVLPALYIIFIGMCQDLIYGYTAIVNWAFVSNLSPISSMVQRLFAIDYNDLYDYGFGNQNFYKIANTSIIIWVVVAIALLFVTVKLYEKRKSEQAESTDTHGILKIFLRIAGTFAGAVGTGYVFRTIFEGMAYMYIGVFVGGILCYITMDIIFARSFKRILKSMPGAAITAVATALVVVVLSNGAFGYASSIPTLDAIQSVTINHRGAYGTYNEYASSNISRGNRLREVTLESKEAIEIILNAHKMQVDGYKNKTNEKEIYYDGQYNNGLSITYTLKNGKTVARSYNFMYNDAVKTHAQINTNAEFVTKTHPAFRTTYDMTRGAITIYNALGTGSDVKLNRAQFDGLMKAISNDMLSRTYEDIANPKALPLGYIQMHYIDRYDNITEKPNGTLFSDGYFIIDEGSSYTINYLEELGYSTTTLRADINKIQGLLISTYGSGKDSYVFQTNIDEMYSNELSYYRQQRKDQEDAEYFNNEFFIDDKSEIASIMKNARGSFIEDGERYVYVRIVATDDTENNPDGIHATLNYAIKISDLPQNIAEKLSIGGPYYIDKYGNRVYNKVASEQNVIIGGADGPTTIYATNTTTVPTLKLQQEQVALPSAEIVLSQVSK